MPEKDDGNIESEYQRTLKALVLRDILMGKSEVDGNALAEEARRIVNGGREEDETHFKTNTQNPQNTDESKLHQPEE